MNENEGAGGGRRGEERERNGLIGQLQLINTNRQC